MKKLIKPTNDIVHYNQRGKYLCNPSCNTFPTKKTLDKSKVTCENCLRNLNNKSINYSTKKVRALRRKIDKGEVDISKYEDMADNYESTEEKINHTISFNFRVWVSLLIANIALIFHRNTLAVSWFLLVIVFLIMEEFKEMKNDR